MSLRIVRLVLLALLLATVAILIFGPDSKDHVKDIEKALDAGKKVDWWDDAAIGVRYAAWINLGLLTVLLATSGFWGITKDAISKVALWEDKARWFWPVVLFAMLLGVAVRAPLASKSLWWDESWQMMQASHGRWKVDAKDPDKVEFQRHDWKRAAWYYQKPTNHAPMSVAQKSSQSVWRLFTGAPPHAFSDLAARVPALLSSALSVLLLACLLRSWGRPAAGVWAAMLLALHPWALRYGVDARGYAFVLPMSIAALFAVTRLVQTRGTSWWAWLGLALAEFVWLWAYPQAVFDLLMVNLVLIGLLWMRVEKDQRWSMLGRVVAVNVMAATLFIQAFLPNAMQALRWAGNETVSQPFSLSLFNSLLSHLFLGVAHGWGPGVEAAGLPTSYPSAAPWGLTVEFLWLMPVLLIALWFFTPKDFGGLKKGPWLLLAAPVVGSGLYVAMSVVTDGYFYPRFVISMLPVWLAFTCLVLGSNKPGFNWRIVPVAMVLVMLISPVWAAQLKVLMERPIAPIHDVADFMSEKVTATDGKALIACFGHGREIMPLYAPNMRLIDSFADLQALAQEAKDAQRPLYVAYGHVQFNSGVFPEAIQMLRAPTLFREIAAFNGIESEFYYRVLESVTITNP
ncbi:hypothetical protein FEM03_05610 [Phragmitibacter flavus]|uniref:Uncharacterized protein n=1 Tax=Phragmitibacter flavus TaxID=2576071 RepID=A0A5R8KH78_9BACT|nr:glycosyltransferase family 39 protein [Phragmitibacter flavus]TLD71617.1 hypothetical protein FEM03_05610 [Phragmitibacter flavus]